MARQTTQVDFQQIELKTFKGGDGGQSGLRARPVAARRSCLRFAVRERSQRTSREQIDWHTSRVGQHFRFQTGIQLHLGRLDELQVATSLRLICGSFASKRDERRAMSDFPSFHVQSTPSCITRARNVRLAFPMRRPTAIRTQRAQLACGDQFASRAGRHDSNQAAGPNNQLDARRYLDHNLRTNLAASSRFSV